MLQDAMMAIGGHHPVAVRTPPNALRTSPEEWVGELRKLGEHWLMLNPNG